MEGNLSDSGPIKDAPKLSVNLTDFDTIDCIGSGTFGKVYKVRHKTQGKIFALKIIFKKMIHKHDSDRFIQTEKDIMAKITHPYIVSLKYAFHSKSRLFLVMEFLAVGEFFKHLKKYGCLNEDQARIFIGEIALAIFHLHSLNIIHRDIKPENILVQNDGHIALSDFGLARYFDESEPTLIGNNLYVAPELLQGMPCKNEVDWWSLGCISYEMIMNKPPFCLSDPTLAYSQVKITPLNFPPFLSENCVHLIQSLLDRDPNSRLGSDTTDGFTSIKNHHFFDNFDWDKLLHKEIPPPVTFEIPSPNSPIENRDFKIEPKIMLASPTLISSSPEFRNIDFLHPDLMPPPLDLNLSNSSIPSNSSNLSIPSPGSLPLYRNITFSPRQHRSGLVDLSPSSHRRPRSCSCLTIKEGNKRGYKDVNKSELRQLLGILAGKAVNTHVSNWARRLSVDELDTGILPRTTRTQRFSFHG